MCISSPTRYDFARAMNRHVILGNANRCISHFGGKKLNKMGMGQNHNPSDYTQKIEMAYFCPCQKRYMALC